jgi:hypothetical protein
VKKLNPPKITTTPTIANKGLLLIGLILMGFTASTYALSTSVPRNYKWNRSALDINTRTPPVQISVTDQQGHITGADPSLTVNSIGEQNYPHGGLSQIALSSCVQENIGDDENNGQPDTSTNWAIGILDGGTQTYTLHLKGIATGTATVFIAGNFPKGVTPRTVSTSFSVLASPDVTHEVQLVFNLSNKSLTTNRIVAGGDLLQDVKTACQLGQITSKKVCKRLTNAAKEIQDALEDHHKEKARELVKDFLDSLGDLKGDGDKDKDGRNAIQEPALTILKEDAKTLLAQIERTEQGHHDDNNSEGNDKDGH